jgi:hypothetical protein
MLDRWVMKTEEILAGHRSFLPQEVVWREIWARGLKRKHNYIQQSPRKDM